MIETALLLATTLGGLTMSYDVTATHTAGLDDATSLAISRDGRKMAIGDANANAVSFYYRSDTADPWAPLCTIQPPGNQGFGASVAFAPEIGLPDWAEWKMYVGAPLDDGSEPWHAEGYSLLPQEHLRDVNGTVRTAQWVGEADPVMSQTEVLPDQGVVYRISPVFFCNTPGINSWSGPTPPWDVQVLRPPKPTAGAHFGASIATQVNNTGLPPDPSLGRASDEFVVVGAPGHGPAKEGAAFVFWDVGLWRDFQTGALYSTFYHHARADGQPNDELGLVVAADEGIMAIGGRGVVAIHRTYQNLVLDPPLAFPSLTTSGAARINGSTYSFGQSLAFVDSGTLAVGEPRVDLSGSNPDSGAAHIYQPYAVPPVHEMSLATPDYSGVIGGMSLYGDDRFGTAMDAEPERLLVGIPGKDRAVVFERAAPGDNKSWKHVQQGGTSCGGIEGIYPSDGTVMPDGCEGNLSAGTDGFGRLIALGEGTLVSVDPNLADPTTGQLATYFEFETNG